MRSQLRGLTVRQAQDQGRHPLELHSANAAATCSAGVACIALSDRPVTDRHVESRNWNRPDALDLGFWMVGFPPDSHIITRHAVGTWSAGKYDAISSSQPPQLPAGSGVETGGGAGVVVGGGGGGGGAVVVVVGSVVVGGAVVAVVLVVDGEGANVLSTASRPREVNGGASLWPVVATSWGASAQPPSRSPIASTAATAALRRVGT